MNENAKTIKTLLKKGKVCFDYAGHRYIITEYFNEEFYGRMTLYKYEETANSWSGNSWSIDFETIKEATNIQLYKEETNEEKIKRLLKDGFVELDYTGDKVVLFNYIDGVFYGRWKSTSGWHASQYCFENEINKFTNITPYTE